MRLLKITTSTLMVIYLLFGVCYAQSAEEYYDKGIKYGTQGKFEEAQKEFKKAVEVNHAYRPAKKCLDLTANILNEKIKREVAISLFIGIDHANKGKLDEAAVAFKKAINIDKNCAESYENLGAIYGHKGMFDEATGMFKKAIAINPGYAEAHYELGLCYYNKKIDERMLEDAVNEFEKCIELKPDDYGEAYLALGVVYYYAKRYNLAIKHCDKAVELGCKVDPRFLKAIEAYRGYTGSIHEAAVEGNLTKVMELIKGGIPVDAVDNEGYTALHYAVATGHSEIVKYLVEQGANVNAKVCAGHIVRNELKPDNRVETVVVGEYYDTVLDLAVKKNDTKIAEYLKSKGGRSAKEEVKR